MKERKVTFDENITEPSDRRPCECDSCRHCNIILGSCNKWADKRCTRCTEYRCDGCINDKLKCLRAKFCEEM